jgi:hypothetical protein
LYDQDIVQFSELINGYSIDTYWVSYLNEWMWYELDFSSLKIIANDNTLKWKCSNRNWSMPIRCHGPVEKETITHAHTPHKLAE